MSRVDGNRALEILYRTLFEGQFAFVPQGEHSVSDVLRLVKRHLPHLCDDDCHCPPEHNNGSSYPEWKHVARAALKNLRRYGVPIIYRREVRVWSFGFAEGKTRPTVTSAREGRMLYRLHLKLERKRSRPIVILKKRTVLNSTGKLLCEACDFDFCVTYGDDLGSGFAECHHRIPLSASDAERETTLADLAIVCANCHRMLHKRPSLWVEDLRALLESRGHFG